MGLADRAPRYAQRLEELLRMQTTRRRPISLTLAASLMCVAAIGCVTPDGGGEDEPLVIGGDAILPDGAAGDAMPEAAPDGAPADAAGDMAPPDMAPDMAPEMDPGLFVYPDGVPDPDSLYFRGECVDGFCDEVPVFDAWHRGPLRRCVVEDGALRLETEAIEGGASRFTLRFVVEPARAFDLAPETTRADWSLPDGASAFLWFAEDGVEVRSSGSVRLAECGETIAGTFSLRDLCEYHGCAFEPWTTHVEGAFRCRPPTPIPCGP